MEKCGKEIRDHENVLRQKIFFSILGENKQKEYSGTKNEVGNTNKSGLQETREWRGGRCSIQEKSGF